MPKITWSSYASQLGTRRRWHPRKGRHVRGQLIFSLIITCPCGVSAEKIRMSQCFVAKLSSPKISAFRFVSRREAVRHISVYAFDETSEWTHDGGHFYMTKCCQLLFSLVTIGFKKHDFANLLTSCSKPDQVDCDGFRLWSVHRESQNITTEWGARSRLKLVCSLLLHILRLSETVLTLVRVCHNVHVRYSPLRNTNLRIYHATCTVNVSHAFFPANVSPRLTV